MLQQILVQIERCIYIAVRRGQVAPYRREGQIVYLRPVDALPSDQLLSIEEASQTDNWMLEVPLEGEL